MALNPLAELAIALPFKIDALGKVGASNDQTKVWADRVRSVVGTALGQRVYRPNFGCTAASGIFESEELVSNTIQADIADAFSAHLPLLTLENVGVEVDPSTQIITVDIQYSTPSGNDFAVRLGIATIVGNNPISEEFTWQIQ